MTAILKGCCALKYCGQATGMIANDIIGRDGGGRAIENGELREHVTQIARAVGISKPISLVEKPALNIIALGQIAGIAPYLQTVSSSSFGNSIVPIKAGVAYHAENQLEPNELKFFLTKQIIHLKSNTSLIVNIVSLVVAIATTLLLAPIMPIASYFIGAFAGALVHTIVQKLSERRNDRLAMQYSTPAIREAAIRCFERIREALPQGAMRNQIASKVDRLRSYLNLPALPAAQA